MEVNYIMQNCMRYYVMSYPPGAIHFLYSWAVLGLISLLSANAYCEVIMQPSLMIAVILSSFYRQQYGPAFLHYVDLWHVFHESLLVRRNNREWPIK